LGIRLFDLLTVLSGTAPNNLNLWTRYPPAYNQFALLSATTRLTSKSDRGTILVTHGQAHLPLRNLEPFVLPDWL
jgi:hypothetical protein